jgi:hypothetical protein
MSPRTLWDSTPVHPSSNNFAITVFCELSKKTEKVCLASYPAGCKWGRFPQEAKFVFPVCYKVRGDFFAEILLSFILLLEMKHDFQGDYSFLTIFGQQMVFYHFSYATKEEKSSTLRIE